MNIFVTHGDGYNDAVMLDDLRLNKMILENAQMICDALRRHGVTEDVFPALYKPCNPKHPCTLWTGETRSNFKWLCRHTGQMALEREHRGFREHKSLDVVVQASKLSHKIPDGDLTPFVNCTSDFKWVDDIHEAYRSQMAMKWMNDDRMPKWTNRQPPEFYEGWHGDMEKCNHGRN